MNLDEILKKVIITYKQESIKFTDDYFGFHEAKSQIKQLLLDIVGEDEELGADGLTKSDGATVNNLRAELRSKIEKL